MNRHININLSQWHYEAECELIVYSALFGDYDQISDAPCHTPQTHFVLYTDKLRAVKGWTQIIVDLNQFPSPALANRAFKFFPHQLFPNTATSLYSDANIEFLCDPIPAVKNALGKKTVVSVTPHLERACIYDEAVECVVLRRATYNSVKNHMETLLEAKYPKNYGLGENCLIARKHNNTKLILAQQSVWQDLINAVPRDQLSLKFRLWEQGLSLGTGLPSARTRNSFWRYKMHTTDHTNIFKKIIKKIDILLRRRLITPKLTRLG